eukprot:TRINITY_DN20594_c0_g1_i7.p1 TRINITY_DN20594_c0_g1~~TRINITY_DN20594_c0_g1_i7.p1  ORF type:complete len:205 (-),score=40.06 TRINITY_DN20594_c0_g1_i7:355-969(-)
MGCGTGGAVFYLAESYGAEVVGVDIQQENIVICKERNANDSLCSFKVGSMLDTSLFQAETFNFVWNRDALVYLDAPMKETALRNFYEWLRPGGSLMITDHARGAQVTPSLAKYLNSSKLQMDEMDTYVQLLERVGFKICSAGSLSDFGANYETELSSLLARQPAFEERFGAHHFADLRQRWELKCSAIREGGLVGLHFVAQRPA